MTTNIKIIFLIIGLISLTISSCPSAHFIPNFQAAIIPFECSLDSSSNGFTNSIYRYSPKTKFTQKPAVALGIQGYQMQSGNFECFNVQVASSQINLVQLKFRHKDNIWKKIKVNMWISAHPDIILGTLIASFTNLEGSTAKAIVGFSNPIQNCDTAISRVLINGLSVNSLSKLNISVETKQLKEKQLQIEIKVGNGTSLKQIYLSYLIFSPSRANFDSYGGIISKSNLNGQLATSLHKNIGVMKYPIYGIVNWASSTGAIKFESNIDQNFVFSEKSSGVIQQMDISYIMIGVNSNKACSSCFQQSIEYNNDCLSECPKDSYKFSYKNGGYSCQKCSSLLHLEINSQNNGCQCSNGYIMMQGKCQLVQAPIIDPPKVVVNPTSYTSNNQGTVSVTTVNQPQIISTVPTVSTGSTQSNPNLSQTDCLAILNSFWAGYKCACKFGFKSVGGACIPLSQALLNNVPFVITAPSFIFNLGGSSSLNPSPLYPPSITNPITTPINPTYPIYPNYPNPSYQINYPEIPAQQQTYPHKKRDDKNWDINLPPVQDKSPVSHQCPQNEYFDYTLKKCICHQGLGRVDGICQQCSPQQYLQDGICVNCGNYAVYNSTAKACKCKPGFEIDPNCTKVVCICPPPNKLINNSTCQAPCLANFIRDKNGKCVPGCSGVFQFLNQTTKICDCQPGFERFNGCCVSVCAANQIRDANGSCQLKCQDHEKVVKGVCVCVSGYKKVNGVCVLDCPAGQYLIGGICQSCGPNYSFSSALKTCVCDQGYTMVLDKCVKDTITCQVGQRLSAGKCVSCDTSCSRCLTNNICVECPQFFMASGTGCLAICGDGKLRGTQECDDGNTVDGDGCSDNCVVESNYTCSAAQPSVCKLMKCGNGIFQPLNKQQCDDNNKVGGDGCDSNCKVQMGYTCTGYPTSTCILNIVAPIKAPTTSTGSTGSTTTTTTTGSTGTTAPIKSTGTTAPITSPGTTGSSIQTTTTSQSQPSSTQPPVGTSKNGLISLDGQVTLNTNNVFVKLITVPQFTFSGDQLKYFFKITYPDGPSTSADTYSCIQDKMNKKKFTCMLNYNSKSIPSVNEYRVGFAFNKDGKADEIKVAVRPLQAMNSMRALRALRFGSNIAN